MGLGLSDYVTIGTTAANAASGLLGGLFTNRANAKENQKNRDWNEKMWNLTNQYNLPSNVVQRLRDAGLNVALAYQNGGASSLASYAGNLGTQKPYENPMKDVKLDGAEIARVHNETQVAESTVHVNDTQSAKNVADEELAKSNANLVQSQTTEKNLQNALLAETYETQVESAKQNLELLKKNNLITDKEYEIKKQELLRAEELVREAKANADRAEEAVNTQKATTGYIKEQTETEKKQQIYLSASAFKAYQEGKTAIKQGNYYDSAASLNRAMEKTEASKRAQIAQSIRESKELVKKIASETSLNDWQANKIVIDLSEAIKNNKVDRWTKTVRDKYGTGVVGQVLNAYYNTSYIGDQIMVDEKEFIPVSVTPMKKSETFTPINKVVKNRRKR